jgi:hypothetical protein
MNIENSTVSPTWSDGTAATASTVLKPFVQSACAMVRWSL